MIYIFRGSIILFSQPCLPLINNSFPNSAGIKLYFQWMAHKDYSAYKYMNFISLNEHNSQNGIINLSE